MDGWFLSLLPGSVERMFEGERLPVGLAEILPGPQLADALSGVNREGLSGFDRVVLLQARARQLAHDQAQFYADMAAVIDAEVEVLAGHTDLPTAHDSGVGEIRAALTWTRRAAEYQVGFAQQLLEDYPRVWAALNTGSVDLPKARVIIDQTCHLEESNARRVADQVLEQASSLTTGQLRARIQRLCFTVDPESAKSRYQAGVGDRRISSVMNPDGTANIFGLDLPVDRATAVMRRINQLARTITSPREERTMDQLRADVFLDLLDGKGTGTGSGSGRGTVDLHVDLTTLTGLTETPGELNGFGPVIADIARHITSEQSDSEWRWTLTSNEGAILDQGTTRRRPTTSLQHRARTQNPTCVFPGCRMPAVDCDLDHNQAWSDNGPTSINNLAPLCRHDHVIKHHGWTIKQSQPGQYQITSPLGHSYTTQARSP
jgi:Domain of unknown function (DUF222)/HNH endonuclease